MSAHVEAPQGAEEVQQLLVEQFIKLCSDPDDAATSRGVDETLGKLEALLLVSSRQIAAT